MYDPYGVVMYAAVQLEGVYFAFTKRDMGRLETLQQQHTYLLGAQIRFCLNVVQTTGTLALGNLCHN